MGTRTLGIEESRYENVTTNTSKFTFMKTIDVNVDYFIDEWYNSDKKKEYYDKFKSIIMFGLDDDEFRKLEDSDEYMKKIENSYTTVGLLGTNKKYIPKQDSNSKKYEMQKLFYRRYKRNYLFYNN